MIVIFEARASRCLGVCGVASGLDFAGMDDGLLVFETEKWALILFGDAVTGFEGVDFGCVTGEDTGLKNGLSFSSFPSTSVSRRFALVCSPVADAVHIVSLVRRVEG